MIKNYISTAIRNIARRKSFSILNILGLTIGIISFMIILLYIQHELSFNKHIQNYENKYRVVEIQTEPGVGEQHVAVTMGPLAEALNREYPEITNTLRIMRGPSVTVQYKNKSFNEKYLSFADSTVFDMLSVNLINGDEQTALSKINSIVISEKIAKKYFGEPSEAMNKMLTILGESFMVSGIMSNYPETSSIYFEALIPFKFIDERYEWPKSWGSNSLDTYIELNSKSTKNALEAKFPKFVEKYMSETWRNPPELYIQPVKDIHLKSNHVKFQTYNHKQGDISQVYIFSIIAILILVVACINYINLATSMALRRYKEVGVRKVIGASKSKLIFQFLGESFMLTIFSAIIAIGGISLLLPEVNQILGLSLKVDFGNPVFTSGLIFTIIATGLISGIYPALYMSRFKPAVIFSGLRSNKGKDNSGLLRKSLVVIQFSVSVVIIISTIIAISQVNYFQNKDKGYNDEAVYSIPLRFRKDEKPKNIKLLRNELKNHPNISGITATASPTGVSGSQGGIYVADTAETKLMVRFGYYDPAYLPLMNINVLKGRNFSDDHSTDKHHAVILNQIAVDKLGWENPIGKQIRPRSRDSINVTVIGVIQDYNYYSLRTPIEPAAYYYEPTEFDYVNLKLNATDLTGTVKDIKAKWAELFPATPFEGYFMDDRYKTTYAKEINTTKIFGVFAMLCIFISCLGLFGLVSFVINQKTKEIAIRKVFGSNIKQIVAIISKEFINLVIIASIIGIPIAYFYMDKWLNNFAYKISLSWYYFAAAMIIAILIAFATIIYKTIIAANTNPARALRDE
jgi:putative ABC transport system permease protein